MLLSAVSVLVVAQSSSEIPEGLMNNPVCALRLLNMRSFLNVLRVSRLTQGHTSCVNNTVFMCSVTAPPPYVSEVLHF